MHLFSNIKKILIFAEINFHMACDYIITDCGTIR